MIVGQIEEVRIDDAAHELYCSDSYLGGRVMVFDLDTFKFKRGWGAYGHKLSEISTIPKTATIRPGGPEPKEFKGHLTLNISNDGLVYAADRAANRIIVTKKDGTYVKEIVVAPQNGRRFGRRRDVLPGQGAADSCMSPISTTTPCGSSTAWMERCWAIWAAWAKTAASSSASTWRPPTRRATFTPAKFLTASGCRGSFWSNKNATNRVVCVSTRG